MDLKAEPLRSEIGYMLRLGIGHVTEGEDTFTYVWQKTEACAL